MWGLNKKGFTLVELSLSIAFIAILSITITLIINDAISTYRRGLTLNQINTVGMDLVDDMTVAIQNSPAGAVREKCARIYDSVETVPSKDSCESDGARKFVVIERLAKVEGVGEIDERTPVFGAFCTGKYSYVWNSGYFDTDKVEDGVNKVKVVYKDSSGANQTLENFRLLKIRDNERGICERAVVVDEKNPKVYSSEIDVDQFDISNSDKVMEDPEILLSNDDANALALYSLTSAAPVSSEANVAFYSVSFILGTVQGGINVMSSGNFCTTPNGYDSNFDYCAINKFNFAAQANGG